MTSIAWITVVLLAIIGIAAATRRIVVLGHVPTMATTYPQVMDIGFAAHPWLTLSHIIPGLLFMLLGPLQFMRGLRTRHLRFHRWSGRVFAASSLVIGVTALLMGPKLAIGGGQEIAATSTFAIYFLFALGKALWHIRRREIALHREWMIRVFAIGLAVATIRPINGVFFALYFKRGFLSPPQFFGIAFWTGFLLHACIAELWIRSRHGTPRLS